MKQNHIDTIKLINGECLEEMDKLIEQGITVDAIITDPPYGTIKGLGDGTLIMVCATKHIGTKQFPTKQCLINAINFCAQTEL